MDITAFFGGIPPDVLLFYILAAFIAFVVASTFGIGGPIILMPALMLRLPPAQAVAVVVPIMIFNNLLKLWVFRRGVQWRAALLTGVSALPAAFMAALFTSRVNANVLKAGIGLLIVIALLRQYLFKHQLQVSERGLTGWGVIIGGISGFAGAAGPPTAVALKGYGLASARFVGTVAVLQLGLQFVRLPTYISTGIFPADLWPLALLLSLVSLTAVLVGRHLIQRMQVQTFRWLLDAVLLLLAIWLISSTISNL